jgi:hypothetical protein
VPLVVEAPEKELSLHRYFYSSLLSPDYELGHQSGFLNENDAVETAPPLFHSVACFLLTHFASAKIPVLSVHWKIALFGYDDYRFDLSFSSLRFFWQMPVFYPLTLGSTVFLKISLSLSINAMITRL